MPIENIWPLKSVFANCHIVSTVRKQFYSHNHLFPVSELLPNALKSQCTPSFQVYAFFTNPFDFKAFLYFVARSYVLASAVRCLQSQRRLAPCSWTAVAWAVPVFSLRQYLT